MPTSIEQNFRIGERVVQPRLNRLAHGKDVVQIEPKMMQVLLALAERPGEVVRRDELLDTVWAGTVVGDEVLSRSISELRKAFGDDARKPHVIETIPRVGYRLIAPVDFGPARGDRLPDAAPGTLAAPVGTSPRHRPLVALLLIGIGLAVAAGVFLLARPSAPAASPRTVPLTTFQGFEIDPALAPSGNQVAFIWSGPDNGHLNVYVKLPESETPLQLTDTPFYEYSPAWSPDGTQVAFARALNGIFVVPALGGPERKLADVDRSSQPDVAWSPTGRHLAYTDRAGADAPYRLFLLDLETRASAPLTTPPVAAHGDVDPAFSPDGRVLAFVRQTESGGDVYTLPVAGGSPARVTGDRAEVAGLDWTADGRHLIVASNRDGDFRLWRVPAEGGVPAPLLVGSGGDLRSPSIRGERLAYTESFVDTNIWEVNVEGSTAPRPLIASSRRDEHPQFSPDGQRIAFTSSRSGAMEVWVSHADGSAPTHLTAFQGPPVDRPRWSPDGRRLAFDARPEGHADVYLVDVDGGPPRRLTTHPASDMAPTWSRDGQWIYFASNRDGRWNVWKQAVDGGEATQVTQNGGFLAAEAPDDRSVYYTRRDSSGLWQTTPEGQARKLHALHPADWGNWTLLNRNLYFVHRAGETVTVEAFDPATARTRTVATLPAAPPWNRNAFTLSPDARTLLLTRIDHSRHDLTLVDHFQ